MAKRKLDQLKETIDGETLTELYKRLKAVNARKAEWHKKDAYNLDDVAALRRIAAIADEEWDVRQAIIAHKKTSKETVVVDDDALDRQLADVNARKKEWYKNESDNIDDPVALKALFDMAGEEHGIITAISARKEFDANEAANMSSADVVLDQTDILENAKAEVVEKAEQQLAAADPDKMSNKERDDFYTRMGEYVSRLERIEAELQRYSEVKPEPEPEPEAEAESEPVPMPEPDAEAEPVPVPEPDQQPTGEPTGDDSGGDGIRTTQVPEVPIRPPPQQQQSSQGAQGAPTRAMRTMMRAPSDMQRNYLQSGVWRYPGRSSATDQRGVVLQGWKSYYGS